MPFVPYSAAELLGVSMTQQETFSPFVFSPFVSAHNAAFVTACKRSELATILSAKNDITTERGVLGFIVC